MGKVSRTIVASGGRSTVECALREDQTSPAEDFLRLLGKGMWKPDPDATRLPDRDQVHDYIKLLTWCQLLAEEGVPPYRHAVNSLGEGIWEFKLGAKRLTFFDTPGDGTYRPKRRRTERWRVDDQFWWFPEFDEFVRLGHAFAKHSQSTSLVDLREAAEVRKEDLAHDTP